MIIKSSFNQGESIVQIKVPLALVICGYWLVKRLLLSRNSMHRNTHDIASCDYWTMVGCKEETAQLHELC